MITFARLFLSIKYKIHFSVRIVCTVRIALLLLFKYVMRCTIWYHLHHLKNVKNTHGRVLLLVKLQAKAFTKIYFILPLTLILFRVPLTYKQWNLHIYIHKQLLGLSVSTLCKSRIFFFCRCFQCLIFYFKELWKHSTNWRVLEIRDIPLASYMSFNGPQSSRTHFEKSFKYFCKLTESCWQTFSIVWQIETF